MSMECEACGQDLKQSEVANGICRGCLQRRKVVIAPDIDGLALSASSQDVAPPRDLRAPEEPKRRRLKFPCCYCERKLRLVSVQKRTKIRCPSCEGDFYLYPDGRREKKDEAGSFHVVDRIEVLDNSSEEASKERRWFEESGEFEGGGTGLLFETVSSRGVGDLDELRRTAGVGAPSRDELDLADLREAAGVDEAESKPKKKRKKKKRRKKQGQEEGFDILPSGSPEPADADSPKAGRSKRKRSTGRRRRDAAALESAKTSGEATARLASASPLPKIVPALWLAVPLVLIAVATGSASRNRGFAARGSLGEALSDFGDSVRRAVVKLNRASIDHPALQNR